ncbi:hypothetical protein PCANC_26585 [Puccinia coronata f. sp. avenae]|uniref:Methyltransferase type 11 domain-containing protein n=1 Tax=Puccinia coronata f. sp. avenae TaxID=200324 RepID=A0A2N5S2T1_9BASI|nr:hypothetical protein PCANC_26918 [Puccinia coronata f. sp. avenae]PLW07523.1 hypothetical protein PCASD_24078 [Puccinia coronata f. sp. avenae]PLW25696.1 hypothetical protein PCANC_26585 [Puccinia coronata f. sp. avenae]PLW31997.1 hypothetical protein PCASD_16531 [Puccinia coronata f. sp. avenae]
MSTSFSDSSYSVESYLDHRPRYPQELYDTILKFHNAPPSDNGQSSCPASQTKLALDIGCGPGIATAELVPRFEKVIAIDESESMVKLTSSHLPQVECHVASAARMPMIESGTVDLITVATAAHWFPPNWWEEAQRVLKPGGTVALWTISDKMIIEPSHAKTMEFYELQKGLIEAFRNHLAAGHEFIFNMYDTLPLPDSKLKFGPIQRMAWNQETVDAPNMLMGSQFNIDKLRKRLHTYSPIYRWRTENPSKKDTGNDPVEQMIAKLKAMTGWDDSTQFTAGHPLALIMTKKLTD